MTQATQTTSATPGDTELLKRFGEAHDDTAFSMLVDRHGPMVLGICRRILRNSSDADDAFQATFLLLAMKAERIREPGLLGNWLFGVATRTAIGCRRSIARRVVQEKRLMRILGSRSTHSIDDADLRLTLDEQVKKLPEKLRRVIVCCHLQGLTKREAAEQLKWSEGTVTARLKQARELLKARLTGKGFKLSDEAIGAIFTPIAVPAVLHATTVKAGVLVATGKLAAAGAATPKAITLAKGTAKAVFVAKMKLAAAVVIASAATVVSTAAIVKQQQPAPRPAAAAQTSQPSNPAPQNGNVMFLMRQASMKIQIYASQHGGQLPPDLAAVHATGPFQYLANNSVNIILLKNPSRLILIAESIPPGNVAPVGVVHVDTGSIRLSAAEADEYISESKAYYEAIKQAGSGPLPPPPATELPPPQLPRTNIALPPNVRSAIEMNDARIQPIQLSWNRSAGSPLGEAEAMNRYYVEPFFFKKSSVRMALVPGKMYSWSNGMRGGDTYESAIDGETFTRLSTGPSAQYGRQPLSQMRGFNQFGCEFLDWAGLHAVMRPADFKSAKHSSQLLRQLDDGASLMSVENASIDGHSVTRVTVTDVNPDRIRLHKLPPTRDFVYYFDPQLNYAIRRIEERYSDKLIYRTDGDQFQQLPGRALWLPHKIVRSHFTYRMIPDQFLADPILTETLDLTDVSTASIPDSRFFIAQPANMQISGQPKSTASTRPSQKVLPPEPDQDVLANVPASTSSPDNHNRLMFVAAGVVIAMGLVLFFWKWKRRD